MKIKNIKSEKKSAMTLLSIMFTMIMVMVAIVAAMPIITKRITKVESASAVHGSFGCYCTTRDCAPDTMVSVRTDIINGTKTVNVTVGSSCSFVPPDVARIKMTLIGGGGGGVSTSAELQDEEIATDVLVLNDGANSIDFDLFKNNTTIANKLKDHSYAKLKELLNDVKVTLTGADASAANIVTDRTENHLGETIEYTYQDSTQISGTTGFKNSFDIIEIINNLPIKIEKGSVNTSGIQAGSTIIRDKDNRLLKEAKGGVSYISCPVVIKEDSEGNKEYEIKNFSYINYKKNETVTGQNKGSLTFVETAGWCSEQGCTMQDTDGDGIQENVCEYKLTLPDTSGFDAVTPDMVSGSPAAGKVEFSKDKIVLKAKRPYIVYSAMKSPAKAGIVQTFELSNLSDTINISSANIGAGGLAGAGQANGGQGGTTNIKIGETPPYNVVGGAGAEITTDTKYDKGSNAYFSSPSSNNNLRQLKRLDGLAPSYALPFNLYRDVAQTPMNIDYDGQGGGFGSYEASRAAIDNNIRGTIASHRISILNIQRDLGSSGKAGITPGHGGGSASLAFQGVSDDSNIVILKNDEARDVDSSLLRSITGIGGAGAAGAIIFEW